MAGALDDYRTAITGMRRAGHMLDLAELGLDSQPGAAVAVGKAEEALVLAARNLTLATDGLPLDRRPRSWST